MKTFIALTCFLLTINFCTAQSNGKIKNNALSLGVGKTGLIFNISYDRKLVNHNFGFRLEAGTNFGHYIQARQAGGGIYYLLGKNKKFLELGADLAYLDIDEVSDDVKGGIFIYPDYTTQTWYTTLNIGYRRYGKISVFRAGISPGLTKDEFIPGAYISFGFCF